MLNKFRTRANKDYSLQNGITDGNGNKTVRGPVSINGGKLQRTERCERHRTYSYSELSVEKKKKKSTNRFVKKIILTEI